MKTNITNFPYLNKTILQLLGPSVIFVALSLNGGEMLLWPDLVSRYGLQLLWIVPIILLLQYSVNIEIARYTITTGQNTLVALTSCFPFLRYIFIISILISLVWPAWALIAGNIIAVTISQPQLGVVISWFTLALIIFIWFFKKSYGVIENITKVGLTVLFFIIAYIMITKFNYNTIIDSFNPTYIPASKDKLLYLSALAFGGVTGVLNLVHSSWVHKKQYGASILKAETVIDYNLPISIVNWKKWFRITNLEHFIMFVGGNIVGISIISLISVLTLKGNSLTGFDILSYQVNLFKSQNILIGILWGLCIFMLFFMAQVTILDASGHLLNSIVKKPKFSSSRYSQFVGCVGLIIMTIILINPKFNLPSTILQISAALSALTMIFYPTMIVYMNYITLPVYAKPKLYNILAVVFCSIFYFIICLWTII
jgi:hypothetical protein